MAKKKENKNILNAFNIVIDNETGVIQLTSKENEVGSFWFSNKQRVEYVPIINNHSIIIDFCSV